MLETIAQRIAEKAHVSQRRRDGSPYIEHLRRVAAKCDTDTEKAIAWLHDILEDTDFKFKEPEALLPIVVIVKTLTHKKEESYEAYIQRIAKNPLATKIKLLDIEDNLNDQPTDKQREKYAKALLILRREQ